jgi:exopolysaccharide production protein ExoZ
MFTANKFYSVQALRGIAAVSVMFFHFRYLLNMAHPKLGDILFGWGFIGVDLFFIISGFVIYLSVCRVKPGAFSAKEFFVKRLMRIIPTYFVILIITFLLSGAMSTFHYHDKTMNLISALTFSPVNPEHAPFYVDDNGTFGIRWTLNYELLFYIIVGIGLIWKQSWCLIFSFFLSLLVVVPFFNGKIPTLSSDGYDFGNGYLNLMTNPIIWLFISGVVIGMVKNHVMRFPVVLRIVLLGTTVAIALYHIITRTHVAHGLSESGRYLVPLVLCVVMNESWLYKIIPSGLMKIGDISFSLYLIHPLMNTGIGKHLTWTGITEGWPAFVLYSSCSLLISILSFKFIEQNFAKIKSNILKKNVLSAKANEY